MRADFWENHILTVWVGRRIGKVYVECIDFGNTIQKWSTWRLKWWVEKVECYRLWGCHRKLEYLKGFNCWGWERAREGVKILGYKRWIKWKFLWGKMIPGFVLYLVGAVNEVRSGWNTLVWIKVKFFVCGGISCVFISLDMEWVRMRNILLFSLWKEST